MCYGGMGFGLNFDYVLFFYVVYYGGVLVKIGRVCVVEGRNVGFDGVVGGGVWLD